MTHDEMIEAVALALVNRDQERFDLPRIETVADFRCQEDASEYLANARAALEAARSNMTGTRKLKMTDTPTSLDALGIKNAPPKVRGGRSMLNQQRGWNAMGEQIIGLGIGFLCWIIGYICGFDAGRKQHD